MDGRKVSSLSTASDGSDSSQQSVMNLVLEQVGTVLMTEEERPADLLDRRRPHRADS